MINDQILQLYLIDYKNIFYSVCDLKSKIGSSFHLKHFIQTYISLGVAINATYVSCIVSKARL